MAASALFENAWAFTASARVSAPLPRIFTLSFDETKPAETSVSNVTSETRLSTLVTAGGVAAVARTGASADTLVVVRGTLSGFEIIEFHRLLL